MVIIHGHGWKCWLHGLCTGSLLAKHFEFRCYSKSRITWFECIKRNDNQDISTTISPSSTIFNPKEHAQQSEKHDNFHTSCRYASDTIHQLNDLRRLKRGFIPEYCWHVFNIPNKINIDVAQYDTNYAIPSKSNVFIKMKHSEIFTISNRILCKQRERETKFHIFGQFTFCFICSFSPSTNFCYHAERTSCIFITSTVTFSSHQFNLLPFTFNYVRI